MLGGASYGAQIHVSPDLLQCPVIRDPFLQRATAEEIRPIVDYLASLHVGDPLQLGSEENFRVFPRGTIYRDGRLDMCKQGLGPEGVQSVLRGLSGTPIRHLLLGTNALGVEGVRSLADALEGNDRVETLYLGCNAITAEAVAPLAEVLSRTSNVTSLWLKRNPLGVAGAGLVAQMIRENRSLESVDLVHTQLGLEGLQMIVQAIMVSSAPLHSLYLSGNGFGPEACTILAPLIGLARLRKLAISVNPIGDRGISILAEAVSKRRTPLELGLASVGLTALSGGSLGGIMQNCTALDLGRAPSTEVLSGQVNKLADDGALLLAKAIPNSQTRILDLRYNSITSAGAHALADSMEQSEHRLESVRLGKYVPRDAKRRIISLTVAPTQIPAQSTVASRYR
jgi:Ran GTPase-activating protein (RanGAP) involved in mRNA processing and transport